MARINVLLQLLLYASVVRESCRSNGQNKEKDNLNATKIQMCLMNGLHSLPIDKSICKEMFKKGLFRLNLFWIKYKLLFLNHCNYLLH